jgi:acyl-coenzyme A thioesterase PaaI-like protein
MMGRAADTKGGPAVQHKVSRAQNISRHCLVCGADNPFGLHGCFYELADGELLGVFHPHDEHQSYPGRLHGGISTAILDETIGRAIGIAHPGTWGVTATLTVRFRAPVPLDAEIRAVARITRDTTRLFEGTGEILLADGQVAVEAQGKYMKLPLDAITDGDFDQRDWSADPRALPDSVEL